MGVTCDAFKTCVSKNNKDSKLKRAMNKKIYNIFDNGIRNFHIRN